MQKLGGQKKFGHTLPVPTSKVASRMKLDQMHAARKRLLADMTTTLQQRNVENPDPTAHAFINSVGLHGRTTLGGLSLAQAHALIEAQDAVFPLLDQYSQMMDDPIHDVNLEAQIKIADVARGLGRLPLLESAHDATGSYAGEQLKQTLASA